MPLLAIFGLDELTTEERLLAALALVALAGLAHAFAYTAAEGAHPRKRWIFRRSADLLGVVGLYVAVRIWL